MNLAGKPPGWIIACHSMALLIAYLAGAEWVRRFGFKNLVDSFKEKAIERTGYLGHSWTIWCSFLEIAPYLETKENEILAAERFVEFCATQLSIPDWMPSYIINFEYEKLVVNEDEAITSILTRPGFYGHRLITLAYLFKYKKMLTVEQWNHCLNRMYNTSKKISANSASDLEVNIDNSNSEVTSTDLDLSVVTYLKVAAHEAHTLTLADAVCELWLHVNNKHRCYLLSVLRVYGDWKPQR